MASLQKDRLNRDPQLEAALEMAREQITRRKYTDAAETIVVAADRAEELGLASHARSLRIDARRYLLVAWAREVMGLGDDDVGVLYDGTGRGEGWTFRIVPRARPGDLRVRLDARGRLHLVMNSLHDRDLSRAVTAWFARERIARRSRSRG